jgi:hypothetical protein
MMLNRGAYGNARILSRPSVELMTTDQLTPERTACPLAPREDKRDGQESDAP